MACNGDSQSIPEEAREKIKEVFSETPLPGQWSTVTPKNIESLDCAPSMSSTSYFVEDGCEDEVRLYLEEEFDGVFTDVGHVHTFWKDFSMNLSYKLGLTYREIPKMDPTYNEAKLKHHILHPILKRKSRTQHAFTPGSKVK